MTMVTDDPPRTVLTDREKRDMIEGILAWGVQCAECGRDATSEQIDAYTEHVERDPEPNAWVCPDGWHWCGACGGEGVPRGLSGPAVCGECKGMGEYDAHDLDPWPADPSERDL